MVNSLDDAKRAFYMTQVPGALNTMSIVDLETLFFANPSASLKRTNWEAEDAGYKAWTYDPVAASTGSAAAAGTLLLTRIPIRKSIVVTGIAYAVQAAGVSLTAGQNFVGLWKASDQSLIGISADQTANFGGTGSRTADLVGGPYTLTGDVYAGMWSNGTTPVSLFRGSNNGNNLNNGQLASPNLRMATSSVGLTTIAPNPFGTPLSPFSSVPWFGLY